jgi:hypothetical protein
MSLTNGYSIMGNKLFILGFWFLPFIVSAQSYSLPTECSSLAVTLEIMAQKDQAMRNDAITKSSATQDQKLLKEIWDPIIEADRQHLNTLSRSVEKCGWPIRSKYGPKASFDAWLVLQHAENLHTQVRLLRAFEDAVNRREADASLFAMTSDRVLTSQGKPQLYGTQFDQPSPCELKLKPVDSLLMVSVRRAKLGMITLAQGLDEMKIGYSSSGCPEMKITY